MGNQSVHHEASLVIRLTGHHETVVEIVGTVLQVLIPGAVITITDRSAALGLFKAWVEAGMIARRVLTSRDSARAYRSPRPVVYAAVRASGEQPAPQVMGRTPAQSPSGCGQIAVRVGRLTIVCDDRAAWLVQDRTWMRMYETAVGLWRQLYPLDAARPFYEERINERRFQGR